ncbi:hypothetical protein ABB02_00743 [Clostridiaceae bacterium JG1575]|nr:hypothetical protein ABB02_00743 [Clostridiaceae bacterium JG1575]
MQWIQEQGGTLLVGLMLLLVVGLILRSLIKKRRRGRAGCGCSCEGCAMGDACHPVAPVQGVHTLEELSAHEAAPSKNSKKDPPSAKHSE